MYKAVVNCFSVLGQRELCDGLDEKAEGDAAQSGADKRGVDVFMCNVWVWVKN